MTEIVDFPPYSGDALIVQLKSAFIRALRAAFSDSYPNNLMKQISISMEYPMREELYPAVWVQFSFRDLQKLGINPQYFDEDGREFHVWSFTGRITVNILALANKERDEIASEIIQVYAFSRISDSGKRFRNSIHNEKYIHLQFDEDRIESGGQTISPGTAWNTDQLVYEDSYSFNLIGQFRSEVDKSVILETLTEIDVEPIIETDPDSHIVYPSDENWQ